MKITLDVVRQVLKEALGFNSFTASFITCIEENHTHSSAGITKEGQMLYNPQFVERYVTCNEDLFSLVFHELLHPLFGHFIHVCGPLENIAADAIINAFISCVFSNESRTGQLFRSVYVESGLEAILRPYCSMNSSRYDKIYATLYKSHANRSELTTGELIQTLRILVPKEQVHTVFLLGSHASVPGSKANAVATGISHDALSRIAEDVQRSIQAQGGQGVGRYSDLMVLVMEALRTQLSIKRQLLQCFTTNQKVDRFKRLCHQNRISTTPVPLHSSKRDVVLLASGMVPAIYRNQMPHQQSRRQGIAIYLDVSGSVNVYLPKILGILRHLEKEITSIFLFSNQVVETSMQDVQKGNLRTTYGTDFDCIAESILERKFDKAVIITDGVASMEAVNEQKLKRLGLKTLTILFNLRDTCESFASFGDVVHLDEVCIK